MEPKYYGTDQHHMKMVMKYLAYNYMMEIHMCLATDFLTSSKMNLKLLVPSALENLMLESHQLFSKEISLTLWMEKVEIILEAMRDLPMVVEGKYIGRGRGTGEAGEASA